MLVVIRASFHIRTVRLHRDADKYRICPYNVNMLIYVRI